MTQIERLVKVYLNSRSRLLKEIDKRILWGRSTRYQEELLALVDRELKRLNLESYAWAQEAIDAAYLRGARVAWEAAKDAGLSVQAFSTFGGLHRRAIDILAHNTQDFLGITNSLIARQAKDRVREIGVAMTSRKFTEGLSWNETRRGLMNMLHEDSFYTVPWRNGRGCMRVDSYSELVARTTTAEATNTGTINQMDEMGHHLVKMTSHSTTCKVCAPRQGRVYRTVEPQAFPEGDPRRDLPHIRQGMPRWPTYKTVHPNCAHRLLPYIWEGKDEADRGAALKKAREPFDLDPRGEAERKRYEDAQRRNAERMRDRKQWEKYKAVLGDGAPRTLSGFRAMKRADSENYQFMQLDYARQNKLLQHPELALPNAAKANAADEKFTNYLFSRERPDGWAKGVAFTSRLGYDASNCQALQKSILEAAPKYPVSFRGEDQYGKGYEQLIVLKGLTGKHANVVVGWKVNDQETWLSTAMIKEVKWE